MADSGFNLFVALLAVLGATGVAVANALQVAPTEAGSEFGEDEEYAGCRGDEGDASDLDFEGDDDSVEPALAAGGGHVAGSAWPVGTNPGGTRAPAAEAGAGRSAGGNTVVAPSTTRDVALYEVFGTADDAKGGRWLSLRERPTARGGSRVLAKLTDGTPVDVISRGEGANGRWLRLRVAGGPAAGQTGYAFETWVRRR